MNDYIKGLLSTIFIMGITISYIYTHKMNAFHVTYAMPAVCVLTIILMPNIKWMMGSVSVYIPPILLLVYGLFFAKDTDAGGSITLSILFIMATSVTLGIFLKYFIYLTTTFFQRAKIKSAPDNSSHSAN